MQLGSQFSGAAAISYQAEIGAAYVIDANQRAIADATYQSAVADAGGGTLWVALAGASLSDPSLPFQDRAATAYAAWIDAMGSHYVAYATATAQAEANYENAVTIAANQPVETSATTPDDSVALAQALSAYTGQNANLEAADLLALAQADAQHMLAQAQASRTKANAQTQYQENYETGSETTEAATLWACFTEDQNDYDSASGNYLADFEPYDHYVSEPQDGAAAEMIPGLLRAMVHSQPRKLSPGFSRRNCPRWVATLLKTSLV